MTIIPVTGKAVAALPLFIWLILSGCKPAQLPQGNAISAGDEISALAKEINRDERYELAHDDKLFLEQNGLLNEKSGPVFDKISKK